MTPRPDCQPGLPTSRLLTLVFCLLLLAFWLLPSAARADAGCGESGLLTIDNSNCAESGVFALDNRYAPADFDHDGDMDLDDLAVFMACASGPRVAYSGDCAKADFEHDGDVDQADFGIFQRCYSGAGKAVNPDCAS